MPSSSPVSERRVFDAATVALAAAALSQLPALATLATEHLGAEPLLRGTAIAAALGAGAVGLRRRDASKGWLWVAAPLALIFSGRFLELLAFGAAGAAGSETPNALSLPLRAVAALLGGGTLGALLGLAGAALARSHRAGLFLASIAATVALVPEGPREVGAGLGAVALAAFFSRRSSCSTRKWGEAGAIRDAALTAAGLAGVIGIGPIAGRLVALGGSSPALVALLAGLGLALGARIGRAPAIALGAPLLAALAVFFAPPLGVLLVLVGLAGLASGLALRVQPLALAVAALLGAGLEQGLLVVAEKGWSAEKKMTLARAPGDVLQSFALTSHGVVSVVDSRAGNVRELRRDGVLLGSVAIAKGAAQADVITPVLAAAIAERFGRSGGRIACLGLGDGIASATLGRAEGLTNLFLVEPDAAIRALRDDPGDLFHGAWKERFSTLVAEDAASFLRRTEGGFDAVVDVEGLLADASGWSVALRLAKARLVPGAALVRVVRDGPRFREEAREFARIFKDQALAFRAPLARGSAILVGGIAAIDTSRSLAPGIARSLAIVRLPEADLLGAYAAGPEGLRRARTTAELSPVGGDVALLARLLGDKDGLVAVADSQTRLGEARNALLLLEAARALHVAPAFEVDRAAGDARFSLADDEGAVACWQRALDAAPAALSPRLSLATRHYKRKELELAKKLLEEGLSRDKRRDAPARYMLGRIALAKYEFKPAREHFEAASGFEDADQRAGIARQLEDQAAEMKPREAPPPATPEQKDPKVLLKQARLLLEDTAKKEAEQVAYCRARNLTVSIEHRAQFRQARLDAEYMLELAAKKEPGDATIRLELGRARRTLGDLRGAIDDFEAAARLDTKENRALYALGDALHAVGEREAALDAYERGLARGQISTGSARVYLSCADILVELKRYEDAAAKLEEAERLAPGHPSVPVNLGSLYERLGRKPDAVRAYRRWLDLMGQDGGDPEVRRRVLAALERLEAPR